MKDRALLVGTGLGLLLLIGSPWIMRQDASPGVVVSVSTAIPVSRDASHEVLPQTDQSDTVASASQDDADTTLRQQLIGTWILKQHGQRTITIKPDGTARMLVELDWLGAMLYGKRLDITLTWSIGEGVMTQTMQGGEPEDTVKRLRRDFGSNRQYQVVKITDTEMQLQEVGAPGDPEAWKAVPETR